MIEIPPTTIDMLALFKRCRALLVEFVPPVPLEPMLPEELLARMSGPKKKIAERAFQQYADRGWNRYADKVSAFIKFEKAMHDLFDPPELKAPRLIQHRSPLYIYELARYIRPIEDHAFHHVRNRYTKRSWTTKGMNSWQTGERIAQMDRWSDTVWILLDHSRYDSTLRLQMREALEWS